MSRFHRSTDWQRKAIQLALRTMPNRGSQEFPIYGHAGQLLSRSAMQEQILEVESVARYETPKLAGRWGRTGNWPRVSRRAAFFLEAALQEAQNRYRGVLTMENASEDFLAPPWSKDEAAWLAATVSTDWPFAEWLERWVEQEFQSQERAFRSYHS